MKRALLFYGKKIIAFLDSLDDDTQEKLEWTLELVRTLEVIPIKYFKSLEDTRGLFEIRVDCNKNAFRLLCFFDRGNTIVVVSGFAKKQQKTPRREIEKALTLRQRYHEEKE